MFKELMFLKFFEDISSLKNFKGEYQLAMKNLSIPKYKHSKYNIFFDTKDNEKIIFNTRTLGLSVFSSIEYEKYLNINTYYNSINEDLFFYDMYQNGYIIDSTINELEILRHRLNKKRYCTDDFKLTIAPTMNCNFNCEYCYEKQGSDKNCTTMDIQTQNKIIEFIENKISKFKNVDVVWYGGEPLLAFDVIENLSEKIIDICKKNNVTYSASMITNGYLLDKYDIRKFKNLMINDIQVTIDGPENIHNSRRVLKNGKGTYSKIIKNIKYLQDDIVITIRINVDKENINFLDNLIFNFLEEDLTNSIINLALVTNSENPNDLNCIKVKDFTTTWLDFNKKCKRMGLKSTGIMIPSVANYCDADCENSYVIDNLGYVYKCWKDIGNIERSVFNVVKNNNLNIPLFYKYISYDATQDENCNNCKYLPICMGGCPYNRLSKIENCIRYKYCLEDVITELSYFYE